MGVVRGSLAVPTVPRTMLFAEAPVSDEHCTFLLDSAGGFEIIGALPMIVLDVVDIDYLVEECGQPLGLSTETYASVLGPSGRVGWIPQRILKNV
jgi:hypothetical protein